MNGSNTESDLYFKGMALFLRLRERLGRPRDQLLQAGLQPGQVVLDFGCGIGSYSLPAAYIVGDEGMVYALDIHPLALQTVERRIAKENLSNVKTIRADQGTGLPDGKVDVILLYDVLHAIPDKAALLQELARVLKPDGFLSVIPDHMAEKAFLETMRTGDLFSLQARQGKAFQFRKRANDRG